MGEATFPTFHRFTCVDLETFFWFFGWGLVVGFGFVLLLCVCHVFEIILVVLRSRTTV